MEFTKEIKFNTNPTSNQSLTITYNGFLSTSAELTIVYGFGESWEHTTEAKMEKLEDGFTINITMQDYDIFNFCFRDCNNVWDNNYNQNFISPIIKEQITEAFDVNELIKQMLEPLSPVVSEKPVENIDVQNEIQTIDIGNEIRNVLSQVNFDTPTEPLQEFTHLDEILSATTLEKSSILTPTDDSLDDVFDEFLTDTEKEQDIAQETSLVPTFSISPRKLSKFYLFRKRLKLILYKALVKIPNMIFGLKDKS